MSFICKAVACLLVSLPPVAQSQVFTKVTIRPAGSADPRAMRMRILPNGDLIANAVPVIALLSFAYDVPVNPSSRLSALPDWTIRERYDIEAKTAIAPIHKDSGSRSRTQKQEIRGLLADRFRLAMRVKKEKMSVYALTVAPGGPKLQESAFTDNECGFDTEPEGCHSFVSGFGHPLNAKAINMDDLSRYLENWTDLPVVNHTSLRGLFSVQTGGWVPMRLPPPPPNASPDGNHFAGLPTIFTVLSKLGLELHRQEDTLPVYTVTRIERPASD